MNPIHQTKRNRLHHYLNPLKFKGWLRLNKINKKWSTLLANQYEAVYNIILKGASK